MIDDQTLLVLPAPKNLARLVRAIGALPSGSVLCLEGGTHPAPLKAFLSEHHVPHEQRTIGGTIWPRPETYCLVVNSSTIEKLAQFVDRLAAPEVCDHLAVFQGERLLLSAYDVPDDAIQLSRDLPVDTLAAVRRALVADDAPSDNRQ
jgi:hypothetical protein